MYKQYKYKHKHKHKTHTDYMITENSIKLFFYFNSSDFGDEYSELSSDLNSLLVKHELNMIFI